MLAAVGNLIRSAVEAVAVFVFGTRFVIAEHAVAIFHREDFIVYTAVVAVLVAEVVELLSEFSDELVFFRRANFDAGFLEAKG